MVVTAEQGRWHDLAQTAWVNLCLMCFFLYSINSDWCWEQCDETSCSWISLQCLQCFGCYCHFYSNKGELLYCFSFQRKLGQGRISLGKHYWPFGMCLFVSTFTYLALWLLKPSRVVCALCVVWCGGVCSALIYHPCCMCMQKTYHFGVETNFPLAKKAVASLQVSDSMSSADGSAAIVAATTVTTTTAPAKAILQFFAESSLSQVIMLTIYTIIIMTSNIPACLGCEPSNFLLWR